MFLAIYRTVIIAFLLEMLLEIGFIKIGFISSNWPATSHIIRSILVQKK